jgi:multidrug efflux pump subunit AcrA (membrane-fusion protein)
MRVRTLLLVIFLAAAFFAVGTLWGDRLEGGARRLWHGITGGEAGHTHAAGEDGTFWTCGMHPWVILPDPGLCPICHMDLTPLDPAKLTGEIAIDPVVVQNIGVRVAPVTTGPLRKEIRTVGTVTYDEAAVRDVNTKIAGWIEKLYVAETGAVVKKGAPLFELYSPELYQAQAEYIQAGDARLRELARDKLRLYDITPEQIAELDKQKVAKRTMTVSSPHTGVVIDKNAHEGMKIEPGTRVFRIADLSTVWVQATLYEYQLPYVKVGQPAVMTLPYLSGETFKGEVIYVYPFLKEESRQVRVRLEFKNPDGRLKPGMFANVRLESTLDKEAVLAPREAILPTGTRQLAFVSLGEGKFEPREVDVGIETEDGLVEVRDGLKPGDLVVTSGQFLLDSESKMRAALAKMVKGRPAGEAPSETNVPEATVFAELPAPAAESLNAVLATYKAVGEKLVANSIAGLSPEARKLGTAMDRLSEVALPGKPDYWKKSAEAATVRGKAAELAEAKDLASARLLYAALSRALAGLLEETGVPLSYGERFEALTCPMFPPKEGGAVWLQPAGPARNPYMGQGPMLRCVGDRKILPVAGGGRKDPPTAKAEPPLPAEAQKSVDRLTRAYLSLHALLTQDRAAGGEAELKTIRQAALELAESPNPAVRGRAEEVARAAVRQPEDLAKLRAAFKSLSEAVIALIRLAPPTRAVAPILREVFCPMAKASWLQTAEKVQNPYYGKGSNMSDCGEVKGVIEPRPAKIDRTDPAKGEKR